MHDFILQLFLYQKIFQKNLSLPPCFSFKGKTTSGQISQKVSAHILNFWVSDALHSYNMYFVLIKEYVT